MRPGADGYRLAAPTGRAQRVIRWALFVLFVVGGGLGVWRFRRSPVQVDLAHYVEVERPKLRPAEDAITGQLARLSPSANAVVKLGPGEARALLVDDVLPRLVRLKTQAAEIRPATAEVQTLHEEYGQVIERLTDACRQCLHALDDVKGDPAQRWRTVQSAFAEVNRAWASYYADVQAACVRHHLAKKGAN